MFAGAVLGSLLLGVLLVFGLSVSFDPQVGLWTSVALLLWLMFLILVFSPYRLWTQHKNEIAHYKNLLTPQLKLSLDKDGCKSMTEEKIQLHDGDQISRRKRAAQYLRLHVENLSDHHISNVEGWVTFLNRVDAKGNDQLNDPLRLAWAMEPVPYSPVTLRAGIPIYLDLVSVNEEDETTFNPRVSNWPLEKRQLFQDQPAGEYEMQVKVTGDNTPTNIINIKIVWTRSWGEIELYENE